MKKILVLSTLLLVSYAQADAVEDALMNAQNAYRTALKNQNSNDSKIVSLQAELENAQERAKKAQSDIVRLQGEIQAATAVKTQQTTALQQAGEALNSAWNAVYGVNGTKAQK